MVSRDPQEIYAAWRHDFFVDLSVFGLVALAATTLLYAFQKRQREASRKLDEAAAALRATHTQISASEEKYQAIIETTDTGYVILDDNGRVSDANSEYVKLSGSASLEEIVGRNPMEWTAEYDRERNAAEIRKCLESGHVRNLEIDYVDGDGRITPVEINATVVHRAQSTQIVSLCRDISKRKQAEAILSENQKQLAQALTELESILKNASLGIGTVVPAPNGRRTIVRANRALERILGFEHGELIGQDTRMLFPNDEEYASATASYRQIIGSGETCRSEHALLRKDGQTIICAISGSPIDPENPLGGVIWIVEDVTEYRYNQEQIKHLAYYDELTSLPNRRLMLERLSLGLAQAKRFHRSMAIMFMDLDHFKEINDTWGHAVGDELLKTIAGRLNACVRDGDTVSRQGGDEFVIVLMEITHASDAIVVAEKIVSVVKEPVAIQDFVLDVSISIGIAVYSIDGADSPQDLMKKADIAMYAAKDAGRNRYRVYQDSFAA